MQKTMINYAILEQSLKLNNTTDQSKRIEKYSGDPDEGKKGKWKHEKQKQAENNRKKPNWLTYTLTDQ